MDMGCFFIMQFACLEMVGKQKQNSKILLLIIYIFHCLQVMLTPNIKWVQLQKPEVFESFNVNKSRINSFYLEKDGETLDLVLWIFHFLTRKFKYKL